MQPTRVPPLRRLGIREEECRGFYGGRDAVYRVFTLVRRQKDQKSAGVSVIIGSNVYRAFSSPLASAGCFETSREAISFWPKPGQFRFLTRHARVIAISNFVDDDSAQENPDDDRTATRQ